MRLLSTAGSFESPKRSSLTFKWLGKFLKDELMLEMSMKRDLRAFQNWGSAGKYIQSSTSKLQLHKGFKVSRKPCLNLCSFKCLKSCSVFNTFRVINIEYRLLLDLIKERSLLLKTTIYSEFCISGTSCDHSDTEFGKKEYLKQSVLQLKKGIFFLRVS